MKRFFALALALALLITAAACGKGGSGENTTSATTTEAAETTVSEPATEPMTEPATEAMATTAVPTTEESTTAQATTAAAQSTTKPATTKPATTKPTTTKPAVPAGKAQILSTFNSAVNSAVSSKAGYSKTRTTTIGSFSPDGLFKIPLVGGEIKGAVESFLGVGTQSVSVAKGKVNNPAELKKSTLTQADVTSAACVLKGGNYEITLKLKDGSSKNGSSAVSALDRAPICTGSGDSAAFDHKTASNIYTGISNAGASTTAVSEEYSGAVIKATVNASTGKLTSLTVSFNFTAELKGVKYVVKVGDCSGTASTVVKYSSFK